MQNSGNISDGYHTFQELYDHRAALILNLFNEMEGLCWKSRLHADGTMFPDMFITGMNDDITYHLDDKWWRLLHVPEMERAPEWNGHTADDVLHRLIQMSQFDTPNHAEFYPPDE